MLRRGLENASQNLCGVFSVKNPDATDQMLSSMPDVLLRQQTSLDAPVQVAHLEVALHQFRQPLGRNQPSGSDLEPLAVERH